MRLLLLAALLALGAMPASAQQNDAPRSAPRRVTIVEFGSGRPIENVELRLRTERSTKALGAWNTDAQGVVLVPAFPVGRYLLETRRIGFRPGGALVTLSATDSTPLTIRLDEAASQLATVITTGERVKAKLAEFYNRRAMSVNSPRNFITPEEIATRNPQMPSDMLKDRGGRAWNCRHGPTFIDGVLWTDGKTPAQREKDNYRSGRLAISLIDDIPIEQIEAIEIYTGASQLPPQFNVGAAVGVTGGRLSMSGGGAMSGSDAGRYAGCAIVVWLK